MASLRSLARLAQCTTHGPSLRLPAQASCELSAPFILGVRGGGHGYCSAAQAGAHRGAGASGSASAASGPGSSSNSSGSGTYAEGEYEYSSYQEELEDAHDSQYDRDRALKRVLRSSNAAELAAVHYFRGMQCGLRGRPDAAGFAEQEADAAEGVRALLPRHRVRPSLAQGPLSLACMALGAAAGLAPPRVRMAVTGAVGDALSDHFNEQLRQLNEAGAAQQAPEVRQALRSLRDLPRTPEGAPPAPDLVSVLQEGFAAASARGGGANGGAGGPAGAAATGGRTLLSGVAGVVREWGVEGTVGAVVKAGTRAALEVASRL